MLRRVVLWTIDHAQVFSPTTLDGRLHETLASPHNETLWLGHHTLAAPLGQIGPPLDRCFGARELPKVHETVRRGEDDFVAGVDQTVDLGDVPHVVLLHVQGAL